MATLRSTLTAPRVAAGVAGLILVATLLTYFVALVPAKRDHPPGSLTDTELAATSAAANQAVELFRYRRSHFATDYARALDGTTGALRASVQRSRAANLRTVTSGGFDLAARVTQRAYVGTSGSARVVLVTVRQFRSTKPGTVVQQNLQVRATRSAGRWVISEVRVVGQST